MSKNICLGILPFISFKKSLIKINDFTIFSDDQIEKIDIPDYLKKELIDFAINQKKLLNNKEKITFIISSNKKAINNLIEVLFFYLHKGGIGNFINTQSIFCKEDFKCVVIDFYGDGKGEIIRRSLFKHSSTQSFKDLVIHPTGWENITIPVNKKHGYIYDNINFDLDDFSDFWDYVRAKNNVLRAIVFYNKVMSCELLNEERFVWLSSSLEAFLAIGESRDKRKKIKEGVNEIVSNKKYLLVDKESISAKLENVINIVYDYRSSYIHSGKLIGNNDTEKKLFEILGNINIVFALLNIVSILIIHEKISDNKFESVFKTVFLGQNFFNNVVNIYKESKDDIERKFDENEWKQQCIIGYFLSTMNFDTIKFKRKNIEKCLDNILRLLVCESKVNFIKDGEIQIVKDDKDKFKKWYNWFCDHKDEQFKLIPIGCLSIEVYKKLFELLEYENSLSFPNKQSSADS